MRSQIFPKAVTVVRIDILDENVGKCDFIIDVCDFARVCMKIISVLFRSHSSYLCRLDVAQDPGIHFKYCLIVGKFLKDK